MIPDSEFFPPDENNAVARILPGDKLPTSEMLAQWLRRGAPDCGAPETHKVWCDTAADRLAAPQKPAPDAMREALQKIKDTPIPLGYPARDRYIHEVWRAVSNILSAPVPSPDGAAGEAADLLRSWAKAYRDSPEHRFPSDPNAEFFPVDLENAANLLCATPSDDVRSALDREERYLLEHFEAECGIMPGDVEGSFHRLRAALRSAPVSGPATREAIEDILDEEVYHDRDAEKGLDFGDAVDRLVALALRVPAVGVTREAIARIIDPDAYDERYAPEPRWESLARIENRADAQLRAERKADAILALRSPVPDATVSARDAVIRILKSQIQVYSPAEDVAPHVTNAEAVADEIIRSLASGAKP